MNLIMLWDNWDALFIPVWGMLFLLNTCGNIILLEETFNHWARQSSVEHYWPRRIPHTFRAEAQAQQQKRLVFPNGFFFHEALHWSATSSSSIISPSFFRTNPDHCIFHQCHHVSCTMHHASWSWSPSLPCIMHHASCSKHHASFSQWCIITMHNPSLSPYASCIMYHASSSNVLLVLQGKR